MNDNQQYDYHYGLFLDLMTLYATNKSSTEIPQIMAEMVELVVENIYDMRFMTILKRAGDVLRFVKFEEIIQYVEISLDMTALREIKKCFLHSHRKPPKQPYYFLCGNGTCRWCGKPTKTNRHSWHGDCLETFKTIYWPQHTRIAVWQRDRGKCVRCNHIDDHPNGLWDVDHRRRLI
ncbi:MAG: hypothetical protein WC284_10240, partial [Candidimonas sp.]